MTDCDVDTLIAENQHHPNVAWRRVAGKGWGVFAGRRLESGTIVQWGPMSTFPATDLKTEDHRACQMLHHVFTWSASARQGFLWGFPRALQPLRDAERHHRRRAGAGHGGGHRAP